MNNSMLYLIKGGGFILFLVLSFSLWLFQKEFYQYKTIPELLKNRYGILPLSPLHDYKINNIFRRVLFLGKKNDSVDVYWLPVITINGYVVYNFSPVLLTETPHCEEYNLVCKRDWCIYANKIMGKIPSITLLDLRGEKIPKDFGLIQRVMQRITFYQKTGSFYGIKRFVYFFNQPIFDISFKYNSSGGIDITLVKKPDDIKEITISLSNPGLIKGSGSTFISNVAVSEVVSQKFIVWAVDTVRNIDWIGPEPITWLEHHLFSLIDLYKRTRYKFSHKEANLGVKREIDSEDNDIEREEEVNKKISWPPKKIKKLIYSNPEKGEGEWEPINFEFLNKIPDAPPTFYKTFVRPDPERPYTHAYIVAVDPRQVEIGIEAGIVDPISTTGAQGTGKVPEDQDIRDRLVAVFNGGFKTEHGAYGMIVRGTLFLPPINGAATLATFKDGSFSLGTWGLGENFPQQLVSLRQNLEPLLVDGIINPTRRRYWGYSAQGIDIMQTVRSGICMTPEGILIYVWGEDLSAETLGKAMHISGCSYGMHLDMNPYHTAFIFYRVYSSNPLKFDWKPLVPKMVYPPYRYLKGGPKDFFYFLLRKTTPYLKIEDTKIEWKYKDMAQPEPSFIPAIWRSKIFYNGNWVKIMVADLNRVNFDIDIGREEPNWNLPYNNKVTIQDEISDKVMAVISLGVGEKSTPYGIIANGNIVAPWNFRKPTLNYKGDRSIEITDKNILEADSYPTIAIQGEWFLRGGEPNFSSAKCNNIKVIALKDNYFIYGESEDREALSKMLLSMGVDNAIELYRGRCNDEYGGVFVNNKGETISLEEEKLISLEIPNRNSLLYVMENEKYQWSFRLDPEHGGGGVPTKISERKLLEKYKLVEEIKKRKELQNKDSNEK